MSTTNPWDIWLTFRAGQAAAPDALVLRALNEVSGDNLRLLVLGAGTGTDVKGFISSGRIGRVTTVDSSAVSTQLCNALVAEISGAGIHGRVLGKQIQNLRPDEFGRPHIIAATSVLPYVDTRAQEKFLKLALPQLAAGGVFVASFSAKPGSLLPTIPLYSLDPKVVAGIAEGAGCEAEIKGFGPGFAPLQPDQPPTVYEAVIKKPAA